MSPFCANETVTFVTNSFSSFSFFLFFLILVTMCAVDPKNELIEELHNIYFRVSDLNAHVRPLAVCAKIARY